MLNLLRYVWNHPLNAKARFAALWRVLRWQLASRLMPGLIALPYVEGSSLFAKRGLTGATGNWYCGLHEVHEMAFVLHLLRSEEHFVDVGANVGSYTVLAGRGAGARVTSIEPIPETFVHLQRNVVLNDLSDRVRCCQLGLSDAPGNLRFSSDLDTVNHVLTADEDLPGTDIPVMQLDELVGKDVPVLIKIDVEGHELAVLKGGSRTLRDSRLLAVIMETNGSGARYGVSDDALIDVMKANGFKPFGYDPFQRRLVETVAANGNTVFVRDHAVVEDRCQSARKYRLVNGEI